MATIRTECRRRQNWRLSVPAPVPWRRICRCRVAVALLRHELDIRDGADRVGPVVAVSGSICTSRKVTSSAVPLVKYCCRRAACSPHSDADTHCVGLLPFSPFMAVVVCQRKRCDLLAARRVADFCIPSKAGNSEQFHAVLLYLISSRSECSGCAALRIPGLQCVSNGALVWCRRRRWLYGHHLCWQ